jgi:hypothetical protein
MTDFDIVPSVDAPASGICSSTPPLCHDGKRRIWMDGTVRLTV